MGCRASAVAPVRWGRFALRVGGALSCRGNSGVHAGLDSLEVGE
jgi:hypothetical protein